MNKFTILFGGLAAAGLLTGACSDSDDDGGNHAGTGNTGATGGTAAGGGGMSGKSGAGGSAGTSSAGTGGAAGATGAQGGAGGSAGMLMACPVAGMPGMAGMPGVGGMTGAAGMTGTGGAPAAGAGGAATAGGAGGPAAGSGGVAGSGGSSAGAAGMSAGSGGRQGGGGRQGSGGRPGAGGMSGDGAGGMAGDAGATTAGGGGMSGAGGAPSAGGGGVSAAGAAGAPPMAPPCDQIPSLAKGDASFTVVSPEFASCMPIPAEHTCDQKPFPQGTSFAFSWTAGPSGTQSYAVVFKDLAVIARTAPTDSNYNKGFHWVMWDIPTTTTMLPAAMKPGHLYPDIPGVRQWSNFNNYQFFGPCPNFDPATDPIYNDTYAIVVYALPFAKTSISPPTMGISTVRQLDDYFKGMALAIAEYRGTSNAHASEIPDGVLPPMTMPPCPTTCQLATACLAGP